MTTAEAIGTAATIIAFSDLSSSKKREVIKTLVQMKIDLEIEHQKLQAEEVAVMGEIEESKMRYMAETQRTESDASIAHANNLVKILTHKIT